MTALIFPRSFPHSFPHWFPLWFNFCCKTKKLFIPLPLHIVRRPDMGWGAGADILMKRLSDALSWRLENWKLSYYSQGMRQRWTPLWIWRHPALNWCASIGSILGISYLAWGLCVVRSTVMGFSSASSRENGHRWPALTLLFYIITAERVRRYN